MNICKTCKHCKVTLISKLVLPPDTGWMCNRQNKIDPLTGAPKLSFCSIERQYDHLCGPEGKYWEHWEPK